jgi:hypothetical protein
MIPGFRGELPATNRLSYGTAIFVMHGWGLAAPCLLQSTFETPECNLSCVPVYEHYLRQSVLSYSHWVSVCCRNFSHLNSDQMSVLKGAASMSSGHFIAEYEVGLQLEMLRNAWRSQEMGNGTDLIPGIVSRKPMALTPA